MNCQANSTSGTSLAPTRRSLLEPEETFSSEKEGVAADKLGDEDFDWDYQPERQPASDLTYEPDALG